MTNLPGAEVKVTRRSDSVVVASGATDANGEYRAYVPVIPGDTNPPRGYETTAKYRGYDPVAINVNTNNGGIVAPGMPRRTWSGCTSTTIFSFPILKWGAYVSGCNSVPIPGADVKIYQRYADGSTALLLGQGSTGSDGSVSIDLDYPPTDLTRIVGVATTDDFYQSIVGFSPGPGNNPNPCSIGFSAATLSGLPYQYPDVPGLDTSKRDTNGGWNAKDFGTCCFGLNGPAGRYKPFPRMLNASVGGTSITLTNKGAGWYGYGSVQMAGVKKIIVNGNVTYPCNPNPYVPTEPVMTCVGVGFSCTPPTLTISYNGCARACAALELECGPDGLYYNPYGQVTRDLGSCTGQEPTVTTSVSVNPALVVEGTCDLGGWVVSE